MPGTGPFKVSSAGLFPVVAKRPKVSGIFPPLVGLLFTLYDETMRARQDRLTA